MSDAETYGFAIVLRRLGSDVHYLRRDQSARGALPSSKGLTAFNAAIVPQLLLMTCPVAIRSARYRLRLFKKSHLVRKPYSALEGIHLDSARCTPLISADIFEQENERVNRFEGIERRGIKGVQIILILRQ